MLWNKWQCEANKAPNPFAHCSGVIDQRISDVCYNFSVLKSVKKHTSGHGSLVIKDAQLLKCQCSSFAEDYPNIYPLFHLRSPTGFLSPCVYDERRGGDWKDTLQTNDDLYVNVCEPCLPVVNHLSSTWMNKRSLSFFICKRLSSHFPAAAGRSHTDGFKIFLRSGAIMTLK